LIATKGGPGTLSDGEVELALKDAAAPAPVAVDRPGASEVQLGKRYKSSDGAVEVLIIKAGRCDLRYNGEPMELMQPKVLPSAD